MTIIRMNTRLPGPRSAQWLSKSDHVGKAFGTLVPAVIDYAKGAQITDVDGNTFIDLAGGVGAMNVGHSHDKVVEAICKASQRFTHTDFTVFPYRSFFMLAEELARRAPGDGNKKVCFFNSGAEAVENAIKIARRATKRRGIIAFDGAFHGRTMMALSLTSKAKPYKEGMGPFSTDVYRVPYPYPYRWIGSESPEQVMKEAIEHLNRAFITQVSPYETAAIIIEPIQGEAGFIVPPSGYLNAVRDICSKYGILLIADEVQTGYGRTGNFLASHHFGIEPDLITVGKSIAAGMPLSAVIGKEEVIDAAGDGAVGGTFVGNPIACEAALAVLDIYDSERLDAKAARIGERITEWLDALQSQVSLIGDVRGVGAMIAFELVKDHATKEPAVQETDEIIKRCIARGVIIYKAGLYGNVIRFLAPLVITEEELSEALAIIADVMMEVQRESTDSRPVQPVHQ